MSEAFTPLDAEDTIAAARRIYAAVDAALSIRRGLKKITDRELLSIVIFVLQLDRIARAAAVYSCHATDHASWIDLQEQLLVPGYLPLHEPKELPDDQG